MHTQDRNNHTMLSAMSVEMNENREVFDPDTYDDDLSGDAILITPFEVCPNSLGELAGRGSNEEGVDPDSICEEEGETYAYIISHTRVRAALKRPIRLCKYAGVPACLLILEIDFLDTDRTRQMPRLLRWKSVEVTAEFKDAEGVSKLGPEIVMFCPETYTGKSTPVLHSYHNTMGASIETSSTVPAGLNVGIQRGHIEHFEESCHVSVTGRAPRMGQRMPIVKWDIKEDEALKQGVPKHLTFVVAVKNPAERGFIIDLEFSAVLGFNPVTFRVRNRESELSTRVDPKLLRERALNDEHSPEHGQIWECFIDNLELDALMLMGLTNLKGSTVGRTSAFH
jgi:hypothetical protein